MGCEGDPQPTSQWLIGAAGAATTTTLSFDNSRELDITQYALTATVGRVWPSRASVRVSIGSVLDGRLEGEGRSYEIGAGVVGALTLAKQWTRDAWFATGSLGGAVSRTTATERAIGAERETLIAVDIFRIGAMGGRTFDAGFAIVSPYVMARAFGGPVFWRLDAMNVTGTDVHHYQVGAGASLTTGALSLLLDVSALGERSASLGASYRL